MSIFDQKDIYHLENIKSKKALFKVIAEKSFDSNYVANQKDCYKGFITREKEGTTGFQDGIAIPHCKSDTVLEPRLLIFKTNPIEWDSLDGKPITFSFALLIPEEGAKEHLKILAKIASSLIDDEYRTSLLTADDAMLFKEIKERVGV